MEIWLVLPTIAFALLGGLFFYFFQKQARDQRDVRQQLQSFGDSAKSLEGLQREFAGRIDQLSTQSALERSQLTEILQNRLDGVSSRINDGLKEQSETTAKSLGRIGKHLEVIDQAQANIKDLAGQVIGLQDILDNKQARGGLR